MSTIASAWLMENGGKVLRPAFNIPNVGRIAIIADATGAAVGLMTSTPQS